MNMLDIIKWLFMIPTSLAQIEFLLALKHIFWHSSLSFRSFYFFSIFMMFQSSDVWWQENISRFIKTRVNIFFWCTYERKENFIKFLFYNTRHIFRYLAACSNAEIEQRNVADKKRFVDKIMTCIDDTSACFCWNFFKKIMWKEIWGIFC